MTTPAATAGRERFTRRTDTAVDVLPVVHHPDIARRVDGEIGLHLQAATDIPVGRRIWSPVFIPGGQFSVRTPHSCTIGLLEELKLEIQTLSLPSAAIRSPRPGNTGS